MRIDVFSIFPDVVDAFCSASLLGKARTAGLLDLRTHDPRASTTDVHRTVVRAAAVRDDTDVDIEFLDD